MDRRSERRPRTGYRNDVLGMWVVLALAVGLPAGLAVYDAHLGTPPAPDFTLTSTGLEDGADGKQRITLSGLRGQTVLLDMMAVRCESCRIVTENVLRPLHAEFGARDDFAIISIDTWADPEAGGVFAETEEELAALQEHEALPWPHAIDSAGIWRTYAAVALPKLVLIDGDGRIVMETYGVPTLERVRGAVQASLAGTASEVPVLRAGLVGLGFAAGVLSFFSPCSVGLVPAYMGMLLAGTRQAPAHVRVRRTLMGGATAAAGVVAMYALIAVALWVAGPVIRAHLPTVRPIVATLLILAGLLVLLRVDWTGAARRLGLGRVDGRQGFFAFGLAFGLASFGCTGPAFLPILLGGFAAGPWTGAAVFGAYAAAIVALIVFAAVLVAGGQGGRLGGLLRHAAWVQRAAGALLVLAGAYLLWYDWRV